MKKRSKKYVFSICAFLLGISLSTMPALADGKTTPEAVFSENTNAVSTADMANPEVKISLKRPRISLSKGSSARCKVRLSSSCYTRKDLRYYSTDSSVAKVNQKGLISGISPGKAEIICTLKDGTSAKCKVRVTKMAPDLTLKHYVEKLYVGGSVRLKPLLSGKDASKKVSFYSDHPEIADVSSDGTVKAYSEGSAFITAYLKDGRGLFADCTIYVKGPETEDTNKVIFVGASRTKTKKRVLHDTTNEISFIVKPGAGVNWFRKTAFPRLRTRLKKNSEQTVVLCMGVNDMMYVEKYISLCEKLIQDFPKTRIYISTVTPVDEKQTYIRNSRIQKFNEKLKTAFGPRIINTYHYLKTIGYETVDGIHYKKPTAALELDYILNSISTSDLN